MSNWVKLSRKLATSAIAAKPEYLAVWIHLLLSASYKEGEILVGRQVVRLLPGQLVFGRHKFSEKTGVSESIVRSALKVLESLQQITIKSESKFSIITITKWSFYQESSPANDQTLTSKRPASDHNKEVQEIQEEDLKHSSSDDDQKAAKAPPVPYEEIKAAYARILPGKPQPKIFDDERKKKLRERWASNPKFQSVTWWEQYFTAISKSTFLMERQTFAFDWFVNKANFKKIVEGNYNDRA
jgi:hypothetical protein